ELGAAHEMRDVLGLGEVIAFEMRAGAGVLALEADLAARFWPEETGLDGEAVDVRHLLIELAAQDRDEHELRVAAPVAVEIEEAASLDDIAGHDAGAEEIPLQEMLQAFEALVLAQNADRVLAAAMDRHGEMILEVGADRRPIEDHVDPVLLQM